MNTDDNRSPLMHPDCDLRGMEWMPVFGARLLDSDFAARANDAEFRAAFHLWWACWQQVPAGSLPDDDAVLCKLAGLGRDHKTWKRLRAGNALHGFVKCADGRLYHTFQCQNASEAWERRIKERERKAKWRSKHGNGHDPGDGDMRGTEWGRDAEHGWDGTADRKRQDRTGQEKKERDLDSRSFSAAGARETAREAGVGAGEIQPVVVSLAKSLKSQGMWAQGAYTNRDRHDQISALAEKPRPTPKPLSPEHLAMVRRKLA